MLPGGEVGVEFVDEKGPKLRRGQGARASWEYFPHSREVIRLREMLCGIYLGRMYSVL